MFLELYIVGCLLSLGMLAKKHGNLTAVDFPEYDGSSFDLILQIKHLFHQIFAVIVPCFFLIIIIIAASLSWFLVGYLLVDLLNSEV